MKKIIFLVYAFLCLLNANAQHPGWQHKDLQNDSIFGISTEKAYAKLLRGKKAVKVKVAIIDSGIDTSHEDLKAVLCLNPREKAEGKDNDKNGYTDDFHGWDFIGGPQRQYPI